MKQILDAKKKKKEVVKPSSPVKKAPLVPVVSKPSPLLNKNIKKPKKVTNLGIDE